MKCLLPWEEVNINALHWVISVKKDSKAYIRKELIQEHDKPNEGYYAYIVYIPAYDNLKRYTHTWSGANLPDLCTAEEAMNHLNSVLDPKKYYLCKDNEDMERFTQKLGILL